MTELPMRRIGPWRLADLERVRRNGVKVFTTFHCGGGSSMGYKLAGCDVIGGVEIDPQLVERSRANAALAGVAGCWERDARFAWCGLNLGLRQPNGQIKFTFDEATSALDSITEEEISNTVKAVTASGEYITVMIAHRLSTIMHADRIYVLEKGNIIEVGKHTDLLAEKGLYYAMWRQQIGERKERVMI